jgi:hypothetical protein
MSPVDNSVFVGSLSPLETILNQFRTEDRRVWYINVLAFAVLIALDHIGPSTRKTQCIGVADDEQEVFGTSDGHVESAQVSQETESS